MDKGGNSGCGTLVAVAVAVEEEFLGLSVKMALI
jgi:hypothetical protein